MKSTAEYEERMLKVRGYFASMLHKQFAAEKDILALANKLLKMLPDTVVIRQAFATTSGVADLVVCHRGYVIAIELKSAKGTPSPQQELFINKVNEAGGFGAVCRCLEDIFSLLNRAAQRSKI